MSILLLIVFDVDITKSRILLSRVTMAPSCIVCEI